MDRAKQKRGLIRIMDNTTYSIVVDCGFKTREFLIHKYGGAEMLEGKCKEAADLMIKALSSRGIKASKHFGWCLFDTCENMSGEPCAPHCYVLIHDGRSRMYLDCTATQFQFALDKEVKDIILMPSGTRPYWFKEKKPTLKQMEEHCGY